MMRRWPLGVLTIGLLGGFAALLHYDQGVSQPKPVLIAPRPAIKAALAKPPAPPTAFDREMAMTPSELMKRWDPFVMEASKKLKVPPEWIRAVITMESGGRTLMGDNIPITSDMGAMGIMQVLPQTYADMRAEYGLGADAYDPHDNVIAGTAYLKFLYGKYGNPGMFAAYNDGPGNIDAFLANTHDLPDETHHYVDGISKMLGESNGGFGKVTPMQLTRPDGTPFAVDPRSVSGVRATFPGEYAPAVQSVVTFLNPKGGGPLKQGVREDAAAVTAAIKAHGGKI